MTLVALVSLSFVLFSFTIKTNTQAQCLPDQHEALIQLKQGFNTIELHSWNASTDCCIWDGITCDEKTRMVTAVNLTDRHISGKLNPALFNLSSLWYLNLARNQFTNHIIPQPGFERLTNLTHLDLSYSGFAGEVPIGFSALTNLISLKLSDFSSTNTSIYTLYLHDTALKSLLSNLTKLQVLCLDRVNISLDGSEWGNAVLQVGSTLQELSLADCGLRGNFPDEIFHLTRLEYLDLESNRLTGTVPMSLFSHPSLKSFDLSYNQLSGYLHEFSNRSSVLESMNLSNNNLEGRLPISLFKLPKLRGLNLESNNFNGTLNLDVIHNTKYLKYLDLSNNKLSIIEGKTHNETFYASFPQMRCIILASCNLTKVPSFLSYQTNIHILDLSNNKIGVMPTWEAHLTLNILDIHSNRISGPIPPLPRGIGFVDFSSNYFISLPEYFVPSLEYLFVSNNSLMGEIPLSICNGTLLRMLDLSYNSLTGTMPPCLLVDAQLEVLDLKGNKLSGPLSRNISQGCKIRTLDLSRNRINGSLPRSITNCNYLEVLDLGYNQIVNKFLFQLGYLKNLRVLVLRSNHFYGTISTMEAKTKKNDSLFSALKVFDLSSNLFRGIIPIILIQNLKAMVTNSDTITDISQGQEIGIKNSISVIDLSKNGFSGEIPIEIWQLNLLNVLNLSHNALTGPIEIPFFSIYPLESLNLESLDLSSNHLSGPVPRDLGWLPFLTSLNLSCNSLVGEVPQDGNLSIFSNDSYLGNPGLCGSPLSAQCVAAPLSRGMDQVLSSRSSTGIIGLSVSIVLGLGVGFVSVIWAMISWENGRKRFNFIIDSFYFRNFTDAYIYVRS